MTEPASPFETVISVVRDLAEEASGVVPRLVKRTRDQLHLGATLLERLTSCAGSRSGEATSAPAPISPVASIVREVAEQAAAPSDEAPGAEEVSGTAATTTAPAKKAPARKAAAKKAPARKAAAKKTAAKKAPAKKTAAKKAPAKKTAAKKAPAKKAAAKKAPAATSASAPAGTPEAGEPAPSAPPVAPAVPGGAPLAPVTTPPPVDVDDSVPSAEDLPISGYDLLAASQVIARLDGMSASDLDLIRRYETANRNRRTILGRVGQLLRPQG